jgi:RES domain-containing protein
LALDVDPVELHRLAFKHAPPGFAPLALRDPPPDNRWQRGDVLDALYLADEAETAWAEWYRHLAELGVPPTQAMPRTLWTWRVRGVVADLSTAERLARVGLPVPRPARRTWRAFQEIGEALAREGWPGLWAPSAARPEHHVLCIFRGADWTSRIDAEPIGNELVTHPPAPPRGMTT